MVVRENPVRLTFKDGCQVEKYDEWCFFRDAFRHTAGGSRGVDVLCLRDGTCWLIEVKQRARIVGENYGGKILDLIGDVARQVRDTLAGLAAARTRAEGTEREFARRALIAENWRVVLHLEQKDRTSRLRPEPYALSSVRSALRKPDSAGAVDPNAQVVNSATPAVGPWTAAVRK